MKEQAPEELKRLSRKNLGIANTIAHGAHLLTDLYAGMDDEEIGVLLDEVWSRPYVFEDFTHFREAPFRGRYVNVDEAGFRLSANQGPWPPAHDGSRNIFFFGGSTAFGYGVPDDRTVASCLQERLTREPAGKTSRIYNFGRGHYYSTQERILFEQLLLSGALPDMAIFMDGLNEFFYYNDNGTAVSSDFERFMSGRVGRLWLKNLKKESLVLQNIRHTRKRLKALVTGDTAAKAKRQKYAVHDPAILGVTIERYLGNKRMIEALAGAFGIKVAFVWEPVPNYNYNPDLHPFSKEGFGRHTYTQYGYAAMAEFVGEHDMGNNFIWCADIQEHAEKPLYVDLVHYSPQMSDRLAGEILSGIKERGLLDLE